MAVFKEMPFENPSTPIQNSENHKCDKCSKSYRQRYNLLKHERQAHVRVDRIYLTFEKENGRYKCQICHKTYSHSRDLKKHLIKEHPDQTDINQNEDSIFLRKRKASQKK